MAGGLALCRSLLELINTPTEILDDSMLYLNIYILGLLFLFFYNIATGIFSALGDSKTPFIFLAASSTSNIAVDILFVTAFKMGVAGLHGQPSCARVSAASSQSWLFYADWLVSRPNAVPPSSPGGCSARSLSSPFRVSCSRASFQSETSSFRVSSTALVPASLPVTPHR